MTAMRVAPVESRLPEVAVTYHVQSEEANAHWELLERYRIIEPVKMCELDIPAGFRFDLASIPRPLWNLISPFELSIVAPLAHDWLYRNGGRTSRAEYTRAEADKIFLRFMAAEGVGRLRRNAAYAAVRVLGRHAWRG